MKNPAILFRLIGIGTVVAVMIGVTDPAKAVDGDKFKYLGNDGSLHAKVKITYKGGSPTLSTNAGRFLVQFDGNNDGSFTDPKADVVRTIFCVDATHTIPLNGTGFTPVVDNLSGTGQLLRKNLNDPDPLPAANANGKYFYQDGAETLTGGLLSAMTTHDYFSAMPGSVPSAGEAAIRVSKVAWLVDQYLNHAATPSFTRAKFAAVQLTIWDIIQDGGDGIGTGNFRAVSNETGPGAVTTATLSSLVSQYLSQVSFLSKPGAILYSSPYAMWVQAGRSSAYSHPQDQVWTSAPVPEPVFIQMAGLLGLGGLGLLKRQRSEKK